MELHQTGLNYNQMAVLYRANYQSAEIQMELAKRSIPFVVRGGLRYFEQAHIKDVVAHLKVLANLHDEMSWKRIMQMHPGLGEKKADYLWKTILDINDFDQLQKAELKLTGQAKESWLFVLDLFSRLLVIDLNQRGNLAECIRIILAAFYENHLRNSYENFRERLEDCQQLMNFVALYSSLEQLLSDVTLNEDYAKGENIVKDAVILSTIHQAKGLEWSVVFIVGLRDGEFPHYKCAQNEKELEEERRLFYVAATRAKDELNMLFPVRSFSYQYGEMYSKPSMFIAQVDKSKYSMLSNFHFREYNDDGEEIIEAEF
jgi:DNA helicase-2/ATP-dependent DNA helicase PcrA